MSSRFDTPYLGYLDSGPSLYKKAQDNLYFTTDSFDDYRGLNTRSPHSTRTTGSGRNARRTRSTGERGSSHDRDVHVWVDPVNIQSDYREDRNSQSDRRNDSRTSQSTGSNNSFQVISRGVSRDVNGHIRNNQNNSTFDSRNNSRTIVEASHNAPRRTSNTRARSFSESAHPHARPRPRNTRALPHQSYSMGDDGPVIVTQPLPIAPPTPSRDNLPTPRRDNPTLPKRDNLPTSSRDSLPTPGRNNPQASSRNNLPTPRRDTLPTPSRNNPPACSRDNLPTPSRNNPPVSIRDNLPTPSRNNPPVSSRDNLPTSSRNNPPVSSRDNLPTRRRENNRSSPRENQLESSNSSIRSNTGNTTEGIDSNMNQIKHRSVKPPQIRIDNHLIATNEDPNQPPVSPRIRQLRDEPGTTRNPLLGDCPRPLSLDTESNKKPKAKRTISAPELRHLNGEPCFERPHSCVDDNRASRVEHEPRSSPCNPRLNNANQKRSKSLPIVDVRRPSKRHHKPDTDPLRYFAYLGKKFQFRERVPSVAHHVLSAGPVILTSTSVISPEVSNNFRNQFQEIDHDDVNESKHQGACQEFIDCCTCMCCVKAMFYHCTKDDDSEGDVSEHPCACSKPDPNCVMRWGILGMFTVCLPCLFLYLPIQGGKRAVDYFRRKEHSDFETL